MRAATCTTPSSSSSCWCCWRSSLRRHTFQSRGAPGWCVSSHKPCTLGPAMVLRNQETCYIWQQVSPIMKHPVQQMRNTAEYTAARQTGLPRVAARDSQPSCVWHKRYRRNNTLAYDSAGGRLPASGALLVQPPDLCAGQDTGKPRRRRFVIFGIHPARSCAASLCLNLTMYCQHQRAGTTLHCRLYTRVCPRQDRRISGSRQSGMQDATYALNGH